MPTELTDLEVDRVDAVDRPATRRKFLIVKDEAGAAGAATGATGEADPAAAAGEAKVLLAKATGALSALRKAEGLTLPGDVVSAMNELIDAVGDATIAKFEAPKAETKPEDKPAETAKAEAKPFDEDRLAEKIAKGIVEGIRKAADEEYAAESGSAGAASAQPAGQSAVTKAAPRKMGEGLFSNVIMGRN